MTTSELDTCPCADAASVRKCRRRRIAAFAAILALVTTIVWGETWAIEHAPVLPTESFTCSATVVGAAPRLSPSFTNAHPRVGRGPLPCLKKNISRLLPQKLRTNRKRWLTIVVVAFLAIGMAYGAYWAIALRDLQSTDDAYVNGNVVQITPQISGIVVAIGADDTQFVKAGQTLVQLDQADAKVALEQAEAQLARTVREVRSIFATSSQLQAAVDMRKTELDRATGDLARRERLTASGAVSGEELQHARGAFNTAQAALIVAQQDLQVNRTRIDRHTVEDHPE